MSTDESRRKNLRNSLKKRLRPRSPELERVVDELEKHESAVDATLADLAGGDGMPPGFNPESHLAPGVPRLRTLLVGLSSRAAGGGEADATDVARVAEIMHLVDADTAANRQNLLFCRFPGI